MDVSSSTEDNEQVCFICKKGSEDGHIVKVERGLETLKAASEERKDGLLKQ